MEIAKEGENAIEKGNEIEIKKEIIENGVETEKESGLEEIEEIEATTIEKIEIGGTEMETATEIITRREHSEIEIMKTVVLLLLIAIFKKLRDAMSRKKKPRIQVKYLKMRLMTVRRRRLRLKRRHPDGHLLAKLMQRMSMRQMLWR